MKDKLKELLISSENIEESVQCCIDNWFIDRESLECNICLWLDIKDNVSILVKELKKLMEESYGE